MSSLPLMITDTQQAVSSGLWIGIQIQSLTQRGVGACPRATERLHKFNLNRAWEMELQRRAVPTPGTNVKALESAQQPWNQAGRGGRAVSF